MRVKLKRYEWWGVTIITCDEVFGRNGIDGVIDIGDGVVGIVGGVGINGGVGIGGVAGDCGAGLFRHFPSISARNPACQSGLRSPMHSMQSSAEDCIELTGLNCTQHRGGWLQNRVLEKGWLQNRVVI